MKILVVDDSRVMRTMVRRAVRRAGFEADFEEADSGITGLEAVSSFSPDVVLCDWNMPGMDGIDMLQALREKGDSVPFGFVTSEGTDEMRKRAEDAGAGFLISKPFTDEAFREALATQFGG